MSDRPLLLALVNYPPGEVARQGPAHPVLGGLCDLGTTALLAGDGLGPPAEAARAAARRLGEGVELLEVPAGFDGEAREWRGRLEGEAARRGVFVVCAEFRPDAEEAFVIASGPRLPAMGPMPPADVGLLELSLRAAAGEPVSTSLFTEPEADGDEDGRLQERLRQLYGE